MGTEIVTEMGFSWKSHGNGSRFWATNGNRNRNNDIGTAMAYCMCVRILCVFALNVIREREQ